MRWNRTCTRKRKPGPVGPPAGLTSNRVGDGWRLTCTGHVQCVGWSEGGGRRGGGGGEEERVEGVIWCLQTLNETASTLGWMIRASVCVRVRVSE